MSPSRIQTMLEAMGGAVVLYSGSRYSGDGRLSSRACILGVSRSKMPRPRPALWLSTQTLSTGWLSRRRQTRAGPIVARARSSSREPNDGDVTERAELHSRAGHLLNLNLRGRKRAGIRFQGTRMRFLYGGPGERSVPQTISKFLLLMIIPNGRPPTK